MTNDYGFNGSRTRNICLLVLLLACAGQLMAVCWTAESGHAGNSGSTVVIDPGHGGGDSGATGLSATTEKAVALKLATLLADELTQQARVILTRSDDTEMTGAKRTAVANRNRADVFVSLHAGASFSRQPSGYAVHYYRPYAGSTLGSREERARPAGPPKAPLKWQAAQLIHQKASEHLAQLICTQIKKSFPDAPCRSYGAPLLTLEGANSPAILIEFGFLTNPSDEKRMTSAKHQTALAKAIGDGVRSFLKSRSNQQPSE